VLRRAESQLEYSHTNNQEFESTRKSPMKNLYDVLRQKEAEIQQLQKDIEALRVAARLLADESESESVGRPMTGPTQTRVATSPVATAKPADLSPAVGIRQFP
jgi:hypothetical protein